MRGWRNWKTRRTVNPLSFRHAGSSPVPLREGKGGVV